MSWSRNETIAQAGEVPHRKELDPAFESLAGEERRRVGPRRAPSPALFPTVTRAR